jgi:hypothetical protein
MRVNAFLSCSFDPKDKDVVDVFSAICRALDIHCANVDKGYAATPPEKAREMIADARMLIAVATRRQEVAPGVYSMPKAVDEEISMAYATKKPILLFTESGVDTSAGFVRNYCTFQQFDRAQLTTAAFFEKAIASIHCIKLDAISPHDLQLDQQGQDNVYAEVMRMLLELVDINGGGYTWRYYQTRRLRFTGRFSDPIKAAAWATVTPTGQASPDVFKWSYRIRDGSKPFKFTLVEEKKTHTQCEVALDIDPRPEANDYIEYETLFESPYLNPIYLEDVQTPSSQVALNGVKYLCYDGIVPIVRAHDLRVQIRFPASYGLRCSDFIPFVGSYTNKIDYLVESEMKRMSVNTDSFGGNAIIEISAQSPLLQHVYGVAWNPPKKP